MAQLKLLQYLFQQHKLRLIFTYLLFTVEMAGSLLRPFFLGVAVNDLIKHSYTGLIKLVVVHFIWVIISTLRHRYDTRTYSSIYTSLVTKFLSRRYKNTEVSKLSAHSTLAREFIDFLEFDLVYILEASYNILGSLILLYFYNSQVVLVCMTILVPVSILSLIYGKRMQRLNFFKNNELEKQVNVIASGDRKKIQRHFNKLRTWQIRISDQEAWNFGLMEILVIAVIGFSLYVSTKTGNTTLLAGDIIGIYTYILKFTSGLDTVPYTVQRISQLNDIVKRIEIHADDLDNSKPITPTLDKVQEVA